MPSMSPSKYQTLRSCPRLFYFEQVRHIERVRQAGARAFGSLFHGGQEEWWRHAGHGDVPWADPDEPLVHALKAVQNLGRHADTDHYDLAKAEAMMTMYHARYLYLQFERIGDGVETAFKVPLVDPSGREVPGWFLRGKKDALVRFADRDLITPVEHKTTSADIGTGADYWRRIEVDNQPSIYVDAANAIGYECDSFVWDACRKPQVSPELKTPEEKRKMTKGKGCKLCGGSAGGKKGIVKGSGLIEIKRGEEGFPDDASEDAIAVQLQCPDCKGSGWKEEPRWTANVRLEDESPVDYKMRVMDALADNPDVYFKQATIKRSADQIAEARNDLCEATIEIDRYYARAREMADGNIEDIRARSAFPRNTNACLNIYGRRCDFLEVCSGQIRDPVQTQLYRIRSKEQAGIV